MTSIKAVVGDLLGPLLFRHPVVARVTDLAPGFRRVELAGDDLRGVSASAGDKLQVFLPEVGPRTYTPFAFDGVRGALELLIYSHGDGPGARWAGRLSVGERVSLFGPRKSIDLAGLGGKVVLVGDETSFGVARALKELGGESRCLFEVSKAADAAVVLASLGLAGAEVVERRDGHLVELETRVRAALAALGTSARLVLTGKAQSIQALLPGLRAAKPVSKAYWSVGKRGLD